eukprot:5323665-Heterocapsa_arctica.AAC.1
MALNLDHGRRIVLPNYFVNLRLLHQLHIRLMTGPHLRTFSMRLPWQNTLLISKRPGICSMVEST